MGLNTDLSLLGWGADQTCPLQTGLCSVAAFPQADRHSMRIFFASQMVAERAGAGENVSELAAEETAHPRVEQENKFLVGLMTYHNAG